MVAVEVDGVEPGARDESSNSSKGKNGRGAGHTDVDSSSEELAIGNPCAGISTPGPPAPEVDDAVWRPSLLKFLASQAA